jgi:hypothetical protein
VRRLKPNTQSEPPKRIGPHARLCRVWGILMASLPLDGLWAFLPHPHLPAETAHFLIILCGLITIPFLNQLRVGDLLSKLRRLEQDSTQKSNRLLQIALTIAISVPIGLKLIMVPKLSTVFGMVCALLIGFGILRSILAARKQISQQRNALQQNPLLKISGWEQQAVILYSIPLIAARLLGIVGGLSILAPGVTTLSAGCCVASFLLLLCLKPDRGAFVGVCKRCRTPVPIAFVDHGSCPCCDPALETL